MSGYFSGYLMDSTVRSMSRFGQYRYSGPGISTFSIAETGAAPMIVFLSRTPCRQQNVLGDGLSSVSIINEQMYVIGGCHVIENNKRTFPSAAVSVSTS
jgi:hypothetical protein